MIDLAPSAPGFPWLRRLPPLLLVLLLLPTSGRAQESGPGSGPIVGATLHASGARVQRRAPVPAEAGVHTVRIGPLPASIDEEALQAGGEAHLRVVSVQVERRMEGDQAPAALLEREGPLEALRREREAALRRARSAEERLRRYASLTVEPAPKDPEEPAPTKVDPDRWGEFIELAAAGMTRAHADLAAVRVELRELDRRIRRLAEEIAAIEAPGRKERVEAILRVQNTTGDPGSVELTYAVPQALWYPNYAVRIDPVAARLEVSLYGVVHQSTGEDWPEIPILFSTALPEAGASVPELVSQRIRRDRYVDDFLWDAEGEEDMPEAVAGLKLQERLVDARKGAPIVEANRRGALRERERRSGRSRPAAPARSPSPSPRATLSLGQEMPGESLGLLVDELKSLDLRRQQAQAPLEGRLHSILEGAVLPTVGTTRGFLRVLPSLKQEAVPGDGAPHRLLLGRLSIPYEEERLLRAELEPHAYRRLRAVLPGEEPLLAGGAAVFLGEAYLGTSSLGTTAPGEEIVLDLGVDDRIAVTRREEESEEDVGVFSKARRYHTEVTVEMVSHHGDPVVIDVRERIPFTEVDELKVVLEDRTRPAPDAVEDRNGLIDWRLVLPPGEKRTIRLRYHIDAPRSWQLSRWENPDRLEEEE
ncbi:MAG: mucoidy inhibitor MuiA family protein [Planctomycetota bacterium]